MKNLVLEGRKVQENFKRLISEDESHPVYDDTVKDPKTGREIKVSSALERDPSDAVYKLAKKKVDAAHSGGGDKEKKKKSSFSICLRRTLTTRRRAIRVNPVKIVLAQIVQIHMLVSSNLSIHMMIT